MEEYIRIATPQYLALRAEFKRFLGVKGYQPSTQKNMLRVVTELLYYLEERGRREINSLDPNRIEEYWQYLNERPNLRRKTNLGLSASMLRHHLAGIKVFCTWCVEVKALSYHPMAGLSFPMLQRPKRKALSKEQVMDLYQACQSARERAVLGVFYGCGLRRSEGVALDISDIDYTNAKLIVQKGKHGKRREVPVHSKVLEDFRRYQFTERRAILTQSKTQRTNEHPFLLNCHGRRFMGNNLNKQVKKLAERAGFNTKDKKEVSLHHLRHSVATHFKENGMPLEQIKQFLGHSSLDVTQAYLEGYELRWHKHRKPFRTNKANIVKESLGVDGLVSSNSRLRGIHDRKREYIQEKQKSP